MRINIQTLGCKANSFDSDILIGAAQRRGFKVVADGVPADAFIVNSCTVTQAADRDTRMIARLLKRKNPLSLVAVIGCYAQVSKDELLNLPEVDLVLGTAEKLQVLDAIEKARESANFERDQVSPARGFLPTEFLGSRRSRASIKIQDGCNFRCSFCIIPKARGRSRSLTENTIVDQVRSAERDGFHEICLTAVHLAHYGWDIGTNLVALIRRILKETTIDRVRLTTLDPFEIPDELIQLLENESRLCPHLHIALQSGSDKILQKMKRLYQAHEFFDITENIRNANPHTFIGVDVIVGFPEEGEQEFEDTYELLEKSFWAKLHVFPFSARRETPAAWLEPVKSSVIRERVSRLLMLSDRRFNGFLQTQIGMETDVILETLDPNGQWTGHTANYVPVIMNGAGVSKERVFCRLEKRIEKKILAVRN